MSDPWRDPLERDYQALPWPEPRRDVVRDALAQARGGRFPGWRWAAAAALALLVGGWWLTHSSDTPVEAVLTWDGDQVLARELDRLEARLDRPPTRSALSLCDTDSFSRRSASLRRRLDRLKRSLEPETPRAGKPLGTHGGRSDESEVA